MPDIHLLMSPAARDLFTAYIDMCTPFFLHRGTHSCHKLQQYVMEQFRRVYDDRPLPMLSQSANFDDVCTSFLQASGCKQAFIIASRSLATKTDTLARLKACLGTVLAGEWIGISSHTPVGECIDLINVVRSVPNVDCLITLGGGSVTDSGKLVRFALANDVHTREGLDTLWGGKTHANPKKRENIKPPTIPLVHIPTTLSGGEFQHIAAATDEASHTKHLFEPGVDPTLVIQDPEICVHTPAKLWLSSGIRAVDHCVETLCSLQSNEKANKAACEGLTRLVPGLFRYKQGDANIWAISECHKGVIFAMAAVSSGVPLGASHAIGHQLGPLGVGHGETSCILLPAVCRYNAKMEANVDQQRHCETILREIDGSMKIIQNAGVYIKPLSEQLHAIIRALDLPRSLIEAGIGRDRFQEIARSSLGDIWIQTNAVKITEEAQVMEILEMAA